MIYNKTDKLQSLQTEKAIDESLKETFPASDPPAWMGNGSHSSNSLPSKHPAAQDCNKRSRNKTTK